jgi:putative transposase
VEVVKRSDDLRGFKVLPRRWVVERTFGWLMRHRRLVRDYEQSETSAQAWIHVAMIRIQLRRLA